MGWKSTSLRFVRSKFGCHRLLGGVAIGTANPWLVAAVGLSLLHCCVYVPVLSGPRL